MKKLIILFALLVSNIRKKYRCSQTDLYTALLMACENYTLFQARFFAISQSYTMEWIENLRTAILAAMAMPDVQERNEAHEIARTKVSPAAETGIALWKLLETHIIKAFPAIEIKAHLEAAGKAHYEKAIQENWDHVRELLEAGNRFIEANLAALTAGGMPASFQDNYSTAVIDFETLHIQFLNAERLTWEARNAKITANNNVFLTTMAMLKDGQKIFRQEPGTRKLFVFSKLLDMIRGGDAKSDTTEHFIKVKTNKGPVNWGTKLTNDAKIKFAHGDNTFTEVTGDGVNTNFFDKIYVLLKIYTIIITGKISEIIELHINSSNLTYIKLHESMKKLEQFIAQNNLFTTKVVDDILITINSYQTSGTGKVINLLGNEPPSAAGLQAKAELESRGWVVLIAS